MKPGICTTTFFLLLLSATTLGQKTDISLSFSGIANGQYAQLSRIDIRNLDRNCDTTLYWPDTVLVLQPTLGLNDLDSFSEQFRVFQNIPNPVEENTKILLYMPENGKVEVDVSLFNGKQVASCRQELRRGYHSFLFTPAGAETYIFTATCKSVRKSIKMASTLSCSSMGCSLVYNGAENQPVALKSAEMPGDFVFSLGDLLELTGYYNSLTATMQDAPMTNKSYTFGFSSPCPGIPTVTYMGQTYNTVQIGSQCWFKENLNVGTMIIGSQNQTDNGIIEKYCYDDLESNCDVYGGLYQWDEAMQYSTTEGVCPPGWHLPTDAEWTTLMTFLGGESIAGGMMKEAGLAHWSSPNYNATNSSGFTALPGGYRNSPGYFNDLTNDTKFWSSKEYSATGAWYRGLSYYIEYVYCSYNDKTYGFSARCLQD